MIRILFALSAVLTLGGSALGQPNCPNGKCPLQQSNPFGLTIPQQMPARTTLTATPVGNPPSDRHEWKVIPGYGYGWGLKAASTNDGPPPPPRIDTLLESGPGTLGGKPLTVTLKPVAGVPAPKFNDTVREDYKPLHGKMFYRTVRDHWYHQLVRDKKMDRDKARTLVESVSNESIDLYGAHIGINVVGGIGDGKIMDWIAAHWDQILALIKLLMTLFAFADNVQHDQPGYAWIEIDWQLALI